MNPILNIAIRAARIAGDFINKNYEKPNFFSYKNSYFNKNTINLAYEAIFIIVNEIKKKYPNHSIIYKNSLNKNKKNDIEWIIYPLINNINFIRHYPHFALSIGMKIKNRTEISIVYDPIRNELFTASRGQGAKLNNYKLRIKTNNFSEKNMIIAINFRNIKNKKFDNYSILINKFIKKIYNLRFTGSISLDIAYVAAGYIDGFCGIGLNPLICSGIDLLIKESGGLITNFSGNNKYIFDGNVIAGNKKVVNLLLSIINN